MKKFLAIALFVLGAGLVLAQAPINPPAPLPVPSLVSSSTAIAIGALQAQQQRLKDAEKNLQEAIAAVDEDVKKQAPGYHLNHDTVQIEKDVPAKK